MSTGLGLDWTKAFLVVSLMLPAAAQAAPKPGGQLTVGVAQAPASTEFSTKHDHDTSMALRHVYEGLLAYRNDLTIAPDVAEAFSVSDDLRVYRFTIRDGLKFHNGEPVTAADVKWAFERYMQPDRDWGSHCREWLDGSAEEYHRPVTVSEISTPDAQTVVFKLQAASAIFPYLLASEHCMFPVIHPDSVNEDGSWKAPIATGPYKFKDFRKGEFLEVERFSEYRSRSGARDGYVGGKSAYFDTIRFVGIGGEQEARDALLNGKVDSWFDVPTSIAQELASNRAFSVASATTPAWHMVMIQTRTDPLLRDLRIRRAIAHAIDIDRVTREVQGHYAKPNPSAVSTASTFHTTVHDQRVPHDPEKARVLLREAGYEGQPVVILGSKDPYPSFYDAAVAVADMLKAVGINAIAEDVPWDQVLQRYEDNAYQMISMTYSQRLHPTLMYSAIAGRRADHGWFIWEDGEAAALTGYSALVGQDEQQRIFDRLHHKLLETVPLVGIYDLPVITITRSNIKGVEGWPVGFARYWGVWRD